MMSTIRRSRAEPGKSPPRFNIWRAAVSAALVFHLFAIVAAPFAGPPPKSRLSDLIAAPFRPYLNAINANHGYRFFGPDPGPSHLVRYRLELDDGSLLEGQFPDLAEHRPRLLYHRYFMLSEHLNDMLPPRDAPPEAVRPAEQLFQQIVRSYARELLDRHDARRVTLELVEHGIADPSDVARGMPLDDPRLYRTLPLGSFAADDFAPSVRKERP